MTTEASISRRLREGHGQGNGASYQPWLTVQDVPSSGLAHRIKGWTTGRVHHLFSNLERDAFYVLDWSADVLDIREQYPLLPLEETQAIADQIGVRHSTDPRTQYAVVMTTDFLLDIHSGKARVQQARTVKPADQLDTPRVLEKLEIERRYWQVRNVDWGIVTEYEIPKPHADNIRLLHGYQQIEQRLADDIPLDRIVQFLRDNVNSNVLSDLVKRADEEFALLVGTARTVLYHLFATRQIACDLSVLLETEVAQ
jgi:hypothetical protein